MPKQQIDPEEALYVNLKKPLEIRRMILESSKDVLYTLERIEKIKQLRKQKTELIKQLKVQIGEINILATKLAEHLPEMSFSTKKKAEILGQFKKKRRQSKPQKTMQNPNLKKRGGKAKPKPHNTVSEQLAKVQGKLKKLR